LERRCVRRRLHAEGLAQQNDRDDHHPDEDTVITLGARNMGATTSMKLLAPNWLVALRSA
jgi:hypothetical protein